MINSTVRFYGTTLVRADLEELLAKGCPDPQTPIKVRVSPSSNHPTDPGGEITIEMEGR